MKLFFQFWEMIRNGIGGAGRWETFRLLIVWSAQTEAGHELWFPIRIWRAHKLDVWVKKIFSISNQRD